MSTKEDKVKAQDWFREWPVGSLGILAGWERHHVKVVAHESGVTGWPVLKLEEEITGNTYHCFYGQRRYLHHHREANANSPV